VRTARLYFEGSHLKSSLRALAQTRPARKQPSLTQGCPPIGLQIEATSDSNSFHWASFEYRVNSI